MTVRNSRCRGWPVRGNSARKSRRRGVAVGEFVQEEAEVRGVSVGAPHHVVKTLRSISSAIRVRCHNLPEFPGCKRVCGRRGVGISTMEPAGID